MMNASDTEFGPLSPVHALVALLGVRSEDLPDVAMMSLRAFTEWLMEEYEMPFDQAEREAHRIVIDSMYCAMTDAATTLYPAFVQSAREFGNLMLCERRMDGPSLVVHGGCNGNFS